MRAERAFNDSLSKSLVNVGQITFGRVLSGLHSRCPRAVRFMFYPRSEDRIGYPTTRPTFIYLPIASRSYFNGIPPHPRQVAF